MTGFGSSSFGSFPFGGPLSSSGFSVLPESTAPSGEAVDLEFTSDFLVTLALINPASYSVDGGLAVLAVGFLTSNKIRLFTTAQVAGKVYKVTITGALVSLTSVPISGNITTFTGVDAGLSKFTVRNLVAKSLCEGRKIALEWTNPGGTASIRIVRKTRGWVYDPVNDPGDVLYSGPLISSFTDEGPTLSDPNMLLNERTFYYYVVCASGDEFATEFDVDDNSRVMGLSVKGYTADVFWKMTPAIFKKADSLSVENGGGGGYLDQWFEIFACGFSLVKGQIDALIRSYDDDQAPYPTIKARVLSLGLIADGSNYDFDAARREALRLVHQYTIKGSCNGIVDMVEILTGWESQCIDLAAGDSCPTGAVNLRLWDGESDLQRHEFLLATLTEEYKAFTSANTGGPWVEDEWLGSKFVTSLGDVVCVAGNAENDLEFEESLQDQETSADITTGALYIPVVSAAGFTVGMDVEVHDDALGLFFIRPISSIDYVLNRLYFKVAYTGSTIPSGAVVSLGRSGFRREIQGYRNGAIVTGGGRTTFTDPDAVWETNQWAGQYYLDEANNTKYQIESNTLNTLTVVGIGSASGSPVLYSIAYDFAVGLTYAVRQVWVSYTLYRGLHSWLYNPVLDFEARGTRYDYYCRLYDPSFVSLYGAWGPGDVGVFITTPNIPSRVGKAVSVTFNIFALDPTQPAPGVGDLVGYYLNPNQNQDQLFRIVDNDANSVTVVGDITSLVVAGQKYFILSERNANRYNTVVRRLRGGFIEYDMRAHVMFI